MKISKKIIQAVFRDSQLKKIFLKNNKLSGEKLEISSLLKDNKLSEKLVQTMLEDYLDFTFEYPHPINPLAKVMNPIKIVGVNGVYLVVEEYEEINSKFTFFSNRVDAIKNANKAYQSFLLKTKLISKGKGLKPYRN
jgi:hypothetical protein